MMFAITMDASRASASAKKNLEFAQISHPMKKILVVDDSKEIRELVVATLETEEYEVLEAPDGAKAIALSMVEKPDCVIMDVMLPGKIDGIEATRILKSSPITRHCAVLILTGADEGTLREKGLRAGATDFFVKPFSPLDLLRKIEDVFENRETTKQID
jgi:two-component system phosphate regulon response regulator PhoB